MNVGLPGAGIGGAFYLLSALWMPVQELARSRAPDQPKRRRLVARQFAIALSILGGIWVMGLLLGRLVEPTAVSPDAIVGGAGASGVSALPNVVRLATFLGTLGTLIVVLVSVEVLRLVLRRPGAATPVLTLPLETVRTVELEPVELVQQLAKTGTYETA